MNSIVPATASGIVCGRCSSFTVKVRHASVAAVRLCQTSSVAPADTPVRMSSLPPVPGAPVVDVDAVRQSSRTVDPEKAVPAGRYAIRGLDGVVKFYVVDRPESGKWEGFTFVKVQASSELHPIRNRSARIGILAAIMVNPRAASVLYGQELGVCGVCGRTLTDEASRAAGIGPVCASRF